jgi:hypothetical protein
MKSEKHLLGYVLRHFNGQYYVRHIRLEEYQIEIETTNSFFHARLFTDNQSIKELLEELDEYIDEKGYELLRFTKRGTNHFLLPATDEDLEGLPVVPV